MDSPYIFSPGQALSLHTFLASYRHLSLSVQCLLLLLLSPQLKHTPKSLPGLYRCSHKLDNGNIKIQSQALHKENRWCLPFRAWVTSLVLIFFQPDPFSCKSHSFIFLKCEIKSHRIDTHNIFIILSPADGRLVLFSFLTLVVRESSNEYGWAGNSVAGCRALWVCSHEWCF